MDLEDRLTEVRAQIMDACEVCGRDPAEVALLPVSKRHPAMALEVAQACGLSTFGENRVQELAEKAAALAGRGLSWHLIGSLQTNKVPKLLQVPGLVMVQSLDRAKLADTLQTELRREGRELDCLLQVNATGEAQKHGVSPEAAAALLDHIQEHCPALRVTGLMAMGPLSGAAAPVFAAVAELAAALRQRSGLPLAELSMGMTGDMGDAIAAGSTMVRVGTGVFGPRPAQD